MIEPAHDLAISKQAKALNISRGSVYYLPRPMPEKFLQANAARLNAHPSPRGATIPPCRLASRQSIQALWSRIEPGPGGVRLMGLDGYPAPPIPSRPVRKPRRPPRRGFLLDRKRVERTQGIEPRSSRWTGDTLPLSYVRFSSRAP